MEGLLFMVSAQPVRGATRMWVARPRAQHRPGPDDAGTRPRLRDGRSTRFLLWRPCSHHNLLHRISILLPLADLFFQAAHDATAGGVHAPHVRPRSRATSAMSRPSTAVNQKASQVSG